MTMRKILLVDDSKSARYAMRTMLQKHNCEVEPVESAEAALEKIKDSPPDAVFMDHLMPGMSGFDALDAIKANPKTAHIPVVMCTSNYEDVYQKQAREKGALGILPKPGTPESLAAVLADIDAANAARANVTTASTSSTTSGNIKAELEQLRTELTAKFTEQINKLRADLHQRESEYAQALIQKIAKEILPAMLAQGAEQLEQRIVQRLSHGR